MPTKVNRQQAKGLLEALEFRVHAGPPVQDNEILSAREFLRQHDFPAASDYFDRLMRVQQRMLTRPAVRRPEKQNYGGEAAGCWMQVQSIYDHVILSTCYDGEFNLRRGRVKLSHRFNEAGRIDFVELKLLRSLQPNLNGAIRKLLTVKDYQNLGKDWHAAAAFTLRVLPQELVFLFEDIFRCPKSEILGWLINIGHRTVADMLADLKNRPNGHAAFPCENPEQLPLKAVLADSVARPILDEAARIEAVVDCGDCESAVIRYLRK
jgi:hypothetical protein